MVVLNKSHNRNAQKSGGKASKTMGIVLKQWEALDDIAETPKVLDTGIIWAKCHHWSFLVPYYTQTSSGTLHSAELLFTAV